MLLIKSDIDFGTRLFAIETGMVYDLYPGKMGTTRLVIWHFGQPKYPYQIRYTGKAAEDIWLALAAKNDVYDCKEWK